MPKPSWKTIFLSLSIFISGCNIPSEDTVPLPQNESEYKTLLDTIEGKRSKAISLNVEWRDTGRYLRLSRLSAKKGKLDDAIILAIKAQQEVENAIKQATANEAFLSQLDIYNADATPEEDLKNIQHLFRTKFPKLENSEFGNGFYALDPEARKNWEAIEEFPPYEPAIESGDELWHKPFANGKTFKDCFESPAIGNRYPRWDDDAGEVQTLAMAINACRESQGEKPLKYGKSAIVNISAYIAYLSRGMLTEIKIPNTPQAIAAYKAGKKFYFSRRGQLNMACFHCHFDNAGQRIRSNTLGPMLGQTSHWPAYRSKWGSMGSLHRRYKGCNKQVRAKPFDFQSEQYRNLEFFHTFMSNGIPMNGPGARF